MERAEGCKETKENILDRTGKGIEVAVFSIFLSTFFQLPPKRENDWKLRESEYQENL